MNAHHDVGSPRRLFHIRQNPELIHVFVLRLVHRIIKEDDSLVVFARPESLVLNEFCLILFRNGSDFHRLEIPVVERRAIGIQILYIIRL